MEANIIVCPFCHKEFLLTEVITNQIEAQLKSSLEKVISEKYEKQYEEEKKRLKENLTEKVRKDIALELEEKNEELAGMKEKLEAYRSKEKQLLKKERELDDAKSEMDLEYERKLAKERKEISLAADEKAALEIKKLNKIIDDLTKQMKEGQRKAEQGSTKLQGEILELALEELLVKCFPEDEITPIAPGKRGADILQKVKHNSGKIAGLILWEAKRTKNWQPLWIAKLKEDQRREKAELAVIASETLPQHITNFGLDNGVWVTDLRYVIGLASVLRENLKAISELKAVNSSKESKAEMVYNYLTGTQFKQRVESMVEAYATMRDDLEEEKRIMGKTWAKREKQIDKFIENAAGMYGDLQGIGATLQSVKLLETTE
jgi:hypothetical protein